jgi:restriction endonuclease S subunit/type I restriction-modification system DNA methylase subunit
MPSYKCELCEKVFKLKGDYDRHKDKKTPCIQIDKIIKIHEEEKKNTNKEDITKIKGFLDFCHDTLRDKEGIVNTEALTNITMLLFLKFVNNSVKEGTIDLLNIEKYRDEDGSSNNDMFKRYKKYIKYCVFDNIIEDGKFKVEVPELILIVEYIFKHILWYHPYTKNIFTDKLPSIKNEVTYEQLFKKIDKLKWDDMDVDIKGTAYEYFLKYETGGGGNLGQFFTKREVVDYMINVVKPNINENSKFIDPFMGTGGFITHFYNEIKKIYVKNDKPFTNEIKNKLINGIEKNPQTSLMGLNNMLVNMDMFPSNVKLGDSFRNYIGDKYDVILTNPPFGIKGLTYTNTSMFPEEHNGIKKKDYIPHKTNDAIAMAMQMTQYILNKNGVCGMIIQDGKQANSTKEKALIETRKMLVENNNLFQITKLSSGTFLPYTGVETIILFYKKGEKTKKIKFVKLENDYKTEKIICEVDKSKLKENNYSFNYKLYIELNTNIYKNLTYKNIENVFEYTKGTIQSSKITDENGIYIFVTGANDNKFKKINKINNIDITTGENLFISHRGNGDNRPIKYYNGECYYSDLMTLLKLKIVSNIKYFYYYLKFNQFFIENNYQKGACNKTLDFELFNNMQIPVPPIEIQNKIVEELDGLFALKETFKKSVDIMENTYKKSIFEMLLYGCEDVKEKQLKNVCEIKTGKNKPDDKLEENKPYPYYGTGGITGYTNNYLVDGDYLLTPRNGTIGNFIKCNGKSFPSDHMFIIKLNSEIITINFLNYCVMKNNLSYYKTGATIPNITKNILENVKLKIPSLEDQERIIKEMEKYDLEIEFKQNEIKKIDEYAKTIFDNYLNKCKAKELTEEKDESENSSKASKKSKKEKDKDELEESSNSSKKSKKKKEIDEELLEEIKNIDEDEISTKKTKSKNKIIKSSSDSEKEEPKYDKIMINEKEYIKEGKKVYKLKLGEKGRLYGTLDKKGNFEKVASNNK